MSFPHPARDPRPARARSGGGSVFKRLRTSQLLSHRPPLYYGHSFGGSVVSAIYTVSKQADYGYVEATVSF